MERKSDEYGLKELMNQFPDDSKERLSLMNAWAALNCYPSKEEIDAAAHSLSIFWPTRKPSMCVIGLPEDEMRQIRHAAENMLVAAARMR